MWKVLEELDRGTVKHCITDGENTYCHRAFKKHHEEVVDFLINFRVLNPHNADDPMSEAVFKHGACITSYIEE